VCVESNSKKHALAEVKKLAGGARPALILSQTSQIGIPKQKGISLVPGAVLSFIVCAFF